MNQRTKKILLVGKPGSGKNIAGRGLEAVFKDWGGKIKIIGTSNELKKYPECVEIMNQKKLVSDEQTIKVMMKVIQDETGNNIAIDGFPRTKAQAQALADSGEEFEIWILMVSDEKALERIANRLTCSECGASYAKKGKREAKKIGICDKCGGKLKIREDDKKDCQDRIETYYAETKPAIDYLIKERGFKFIKIDSTKLEKEDIAKYLTLL